MVYYDKDGGVTRVFMKVCDEVNSYVAPGSVRDWQRAEAYQKGGDEGFWFGHRLDRRVQHPG
jgi:hypothetical protein